MAFQLPSSWWCISACHRSGWDTCHCCQALFLLLLCLAEGAVDLRLTRQLKKEERGIFQTLLPMAETNMMPCVNVSADALATFILLAKHTD